MLSIIFLKTNNQAVLFNVSEFIVHLEEIKWAADRKPNIQTKLNLHKLVQVSLGIRGGYVPGKSNLEYQNSCFKPKIG